MKNLSLRQRTVLIVSLICASLFSAIYFYSAYEIYEGFSKIENADALDNLSRTNNTILSQDKIITSKLSDWAQWDDAYQYLSDKNEKFEKANLQPNMTSLRLDILSFWTNDQKLVWGSNIDLKTEDDSKKLSQISANDLLTIQNIVNLHRFKDYLDKKSVFISLESGPYLLVSVPVTSTDGKSPVRGNLIAGIKLDHNYFTLLGKQLELDIQAINLKTTQLSSDQLDILKRLETSKFIIHADNKNTINGYSLIKDNSEKNIILYKLNIPRSIYIQSQKTLRTYFISMVFAAIILVFIMLLSIDKIVISKLLTLTSIMTKVKNTGDLNQTIPNLGGGEIGLLAQSFQEMLNEVEKLRASSFHNEKMASLGEMAGGIAHEINNPITIITGSTHLMKKMIEKGITDPAKLLKQVEDINKTIIRISKIVSGLKNLSRDSHEEEFSNCAVLDIVADALSVCSEKFKMNGVEIICDMNDPIFLTQLSCLRVQLSQVIFNLLGNSFDAVEKMENPWVKISAKIKENTLELRCEDSGKGIPPDIQNKIFQPFYTTKEIGKGTGLGLSLSNTIIKRHHGEFFIDNESKNTCFVIKIPLSGQVNEL